MVSGMDDPKRDAAGAVKQMLGNAEDNKARAARMFRGLTHEQLQVQHGQSGQTRGEILEGYSKDVERWKRVLTWVEAVR